MPGRPRCGVPSTHLARATVAYTMRKLRSPPFLQHRQRQRRQAPPRPPIIPLTHRQDSGFCSRLESKIEILDGNGVAIALVTVA